MEEGSSDVTIPQQGRYWKIQWERRRNESIDLPEMALDLEAFTTVKERAYYRLLWR